MGARNPAIGGVPMNLDHLFLGIVVLSFTLLLFAGDWLVARVLSWWQRRVEDAEDGEWYGP